MFCVFFLPVWLQEVTEPDSEPFVQEPTSTSFAAAEVPDSTAGVSLCGRMLHQVASAQATVATTFFNFLSGSTPKYKSYKSSDLTVFSEQVSGRHLMFNTPDGILYKEADSKEVCLHWLEVNLCMKRYTQDTRHTMVISVDETSGTQYTAQNMAYMAWARHMTWLSIGHMAQHFVWC